MVRYDNRYTFRMNQDLKESLKKYCEENRLRESEFVRKSVERTLVSELRSDGRTPDFNPIYANAQKLKKDKKEYGSLVILICNV